MWVRGIVPRVAVVGLVVGQRLKTRCRVQISHWLNHLAKKHRSPTIVLLSERLQGVVFFFSLIIYIFHWILFPCLFWFSWAAYSIVKELFFWLSQGRKMLFKILTLKMTNAYLQVVRCQSAISNSAMIYLTDLWSKNWLQDWSKECICLYLILLQGKKKSTHFVGITKFCQRPWVNINDVVALKPYGTQSHHLMRALLEAPPLLLQLTLYESIP